MLNRRSFFGLLASALANLVAACRSGSPTEPPSSPTATQQPASPPAPSPTPTFAPTPTPTLVEVRVWLSPDLPPELRSAGQDAVARLNAESAALGIRVAPATDAATADLRLTEVQSSSNSVVVANTPIVMACSPRVPVRSISLAQAQALLTGAVKNWSEVGSPTPVDVTPVLLRRSAVALPPAGAPTVASYEDFVAALAKYPGAVALAALADVDFRVHSLVIDGVDPVRTPDQADRYPFRDQLVAELAPSAPASLASALENLKGSAPQTALGDAVTVTMCGDIILGRTVHTIMTRLNDYAAPFRLVADELGAADLTIGDLECSLSDNITPPSDPYTFSFMTYTAGVQGLQLGGIDAVSQANNHSMNFGPSGMRDTLAALDKAGIRYFGIGGNLTEARQPTIFNVRGLRIAFLGFDGITGHITGATDTSSGTSPLVVENVVDDVSAALKQADVVIPFIHWGIEYTLVPTQEQRAIAHRAIDAGASLVVGSHPHWVQGIEVYKGRPIVYSLANFVFDQEWSLETKQGLIMHLVFHNSKLAALRFVPVLIENYFRPRVVDGQDMVTILDRVWSSSDQIAAAPAI